MKNIEKLVIGKNKEIDRVIKLLSCEGLGPHNVSIKWLTEVIEELDAEVIFGGENRDYSADSFAIRLYGKSGVLYRISVHYRQRHARLMAERFDELEEESEISTLLQAFRNMLKFETHWYDTRDGDWESFCIHGRSEDVGKCWPVDMLVSLMHTLADDLRSSLEPKQNTLRRELLDSYPVAWCANQTSPNTTLAEVSKFINIIHDIQDAQSKEEFHEIQKAALKELFNEEVEQ
ncbi:MAG: hypothetical protein QF479_03360 [Candidatus Poseidoniaceae archaeon]|nr:hypothetical protein [Candidatus Poseidoniaceae archaeon]